MYRRLIVFSAILFFSLYCLTAFSLTETKKETKWELVWEENFNGNKLDTTVWRYMERGKDDSRKYHSSNPLCYDFKKGKLILKGIKNPDLTQDTATYLTGGITTKGTMSFSPGRFEIKAKLNSAEGAWPAFWMLPYPPDINWPGGGEIDIMEHTNHDAIVYQTIHSKYTKSNPNNTPKRYTKSKFDKDKFNIFRVDILPECIDFYLNGEKTLSYPKVDSLSDKGQYPFYHDWYLMLDMQLGGKWVGPVNSEELPVQMEIDWVKYYRLK